MTTKGGLGIAIPAQVEVYTGGGAEGCTPVEAVERQSYAGEACRPYVKEVYQPYVEEDSPPCEVADCPGSLGEACRPCVEVDCPGSAEEACPLCQVEASIPDAAQTHIAVTYRRGKCSWSTCGHTVTKPSTAS